MFSTVKQFSTSSRPGFLYKSVLLCCCLLVSLAAHGLAIKADRQQVPLNETFQLVISENGGNLDGIDLSSIEQHFDILNRSEQSEYSMVNGRTESRRRLSLTLAPRKIGNFVIPPITHKRKRSASLSIEVIEAVVPPSELGDASIFLEAAVDKSEAFVGEQVVYSLFIYYRVGLNNAELSNFANLDASVHALEDRSFNRNINGQQYKVVEKRLALFFASEGEVEIPGQTLTALLGRQSRSRFGFDPFSRGSEVRLAAQPIKLRIKPAPADTKQRNWLPAQQVELSESWTAPEQLVAGEPVSRIIRLFAKGLPAERLPTLPQHAPPATNNYSEKPSLSNHEWQQGLAAQREETVVYIPTAAGEITFPSIVVDWFNTLSGRWEVAELPARTIVVKPAAGAALDQTNRESSIAPKALNQQPDSTTPASTQDMQPAPGESIRFWKIIALAASLGWLLTSVAVIVLYRRKPVPRGDSADNDSASGSFAASSKQLAGACRDSAESACRYWPGWKAGLARSIRSYNKTELQPEVLKLIEQIDAYAKQLNASVYSGSPGGWDGDAMADCIEKLCTTIQQLQRKPAQSASGLPPLYPRPAVS